MSDDIVDVTIYGRQYSVRADKGSDYIIGLAKIVDNKMKEIAEVLPDISSTGIAVLAGLNLADELAAVKESSSKKFKRMEELVVSVIEDIDVKLSASV
ncbi:MAG: hypothetical protein ACD_79C00517G0007 [uncultured bacterium]|nr:MAG: hypothetical protein ACD_79C00517G0007 [uncultured bacterium]